ncbi:MAG TPA: acetyl-CoA acetyltransferase [Myxococcota bacterium]|nr:acetyl-CoA acetyltransferase [Myxococcota bacterium]
MRTLPARTPVLVGAGAITQREEDPALAREPLALMREALARATADCGSRALVARADWVRVPRGFWDYADPARALAESAGAAGARSELAEIGVLQTTLLGDSARMIAAGEADVIVIAGGEARARAARAKQRGVAAPLTQQVGVTPARVLRPKQEVVHPAEVKLGMVLPVNQYAMIENALRHAEGVSLAQHRDDVAALWSRMSDVAARNPEAWSRSVVRVADVRDASAKNRMLAFPYTKLHNSQWNVDQAAALVMTSAETARAHGIPESRWVLPLAAAESNHMVSLSQRRPFARSPGFAHAGRAALARAGIEIGRVAKRELYSCFPVAVRLQCRELGIPEDADLTVTGGMAFAGGPLNNFVLQAAVRMAQLLRESPGEIGMLNAVSGFLTKQGVTLWSNAPPERAFGFDDVSESVARETTEIPLAEDARGDASCVSYTVQFEGELPSRTLFVCDLPDGRRALAASSDSALAERAMSVELCGAKLRLDLGTAELV